MTDTIESMPPAAPRGWATSSLIAGLLWVILAVSPTFVTTLLGLPFAGYALCVGGLCLLSRRRAGDRAVARRAGWGVGLGCAGFAYLALVNLIIGSFVVAAAAALIKTLVQGTPSP